MLVARDCRRPIDNTPFVPLTENNCQLRLSRSLWKYSFLHHLSQMIFSQKSSQGKKGGKKQKKETKPKRSEQAENKAIEKNEEAPKKSKAELKAERRAIQVRY